MNMNTISKSIFSHSLLLFLFFHLSFFLCSADLVDKIGREKKIVEHVFISAKDSLSKHVLKLYRDQCYEYIVFTKNNARVSSKRETGKYFFSKEKLQLKPNNKKSAMKHAFRYGINDEGNLYGHSFLLKLRNKTELLIRDDVQKYLDAQYNDPVFGTIQNDYYASNKVKSTAKTNNNSAKSINANLNKSKSSNENNVVYKTPKGGMEIEHNIGYEGAKLVKNERKVKVDGYEFTIEKEDSIDFIEKKCSRMFIDSSVYFKPVRASLKALSKLKVTVLVGADLGSVEAGFIKEAKEITAFLSSQGMKVSLLYPRSTWQEVIQAGAGSHVFIYMGHGSNQGKHNVGGICVRDGIFGYNFIVNELKLSKDALVIFNHVCNGAGSSASDKVPDIGFEEAVKRVISYSETFLEIGAGMYYATNYSNSLVSFFKKFISGMGARQIYDTEIKYHDEIRYRSPLEGRDGVEVTVSSDMVEINKIYEEKLKKVSQQNYKLNVQYSMAQVGPANYTIHDLISGK
jgi:hypothetical protein